MASLSCVFISVCLVAFIFHFGCTTDSDSATDLTSKEQVYYDALEPLARAQWLRRMLENSRRMLKNSQTDSVFKSFICAMNFLRLTLSIEIVIGRLGAAPAGFQAPFYIKEKVENSIKEVLLFAKEQILEEAYILFMKFHRSITGSNSESAKSLRIDLFMNGYEEWECAAVAAAVKQLSNSYKHNNGSQAVIIYRANLLTNDPIPFPDIIRENNNWNIQERHIKILNIVFSNIEERPLEYQKFTLKNGKEVALPMQDPNSPLITCL